MAQPTTSNLGPEGTPSPLPLAQAGASRFSVAEFLVGLVLMLALTPCLRQFEHGALFDTVLWTLVLMLAVLAVAERRKTRWLAAILVLPAMTGNWINHFAPGWFPQPVVLLASSLFLVFVVTQLLAFTLRAPRVNAEVVCAGVSVYLLLGLLWALLYLFVSVLVPNAFTLNTPAGISHSLDKFTAFYFSFISLCTVGYGDIVPTANVARLLAMFEAMTGTLYMAVLLGRLVSLYTSERDHSSPKSASSSATKLLFTYAKSRAERFRPSGARNKARPESGTNLQP